MFSDNHNLASSIPTDRDGQSTQRHQAQGAAYHFHEESADHRERQADCRYDRNANSQKDEQHDD
jgi:hypothetical protein